MIYEMTIQFRVSDISKGQHWYETLLNKKPDFIPHDGFAEWELLTGCWLQIAEGIPSIGSGPLRLGIDNLEKERERLINDLKIEPFDIYSREEVPVKWATFSDPWGNKVGLFEYHNQSEMEDRKKTIVGKQQ
ncbi:VOC family protein [Fredinandcohnia sp. QZ13]|uniref:VOC family protein n=1 Tax=Fredinandcohnia sp. QZ13 TaxID=3073144 RepID=UPI00285338DC|nr:VOC family protein [Fredinandcohnia sp. QZ13]MDR4886232.1 VOC family protein [Fredinandcohnia sp. QZ13]